MFLQGSALCQTGVVMQNYIDKCGKYVKILKKRYQSHHEYSFERVGFYKQWALTYYLQR